MIWPWSEIQKWKQRAEYLQRCLDNRCKTEEFAVREYLKLSASMRGAHKGIWRLKQKLKRYEKEHP